MKPQPECRGCLEKLVHQTAALATTDEKLRRDATGVSLDIVNNLFPQEIAPADIATVFHRKIREITSNPDPFSEFKRREIEQARDLYETLKEEATPDLETLIKFSVKGNALDFFRSKDQILQDFHSQISFTINHIEMLRNRLKPGAVALFLADNAGECFFDLPLVQYFSGSGIKIIYVVKGGPSQNDITEYDLELSGLSGDFQEVVNNGTDVVGLHLSEASVEFRKIYDDADIIIAKGMGHFETMGHITDDRLFFLLKAKCRPVAAAVGVSHESYALKQASGPGPVPPA
jgi:uncharacterized protein with ATP-grasp and redox domains